MRIFAFFFSLFFFSSAFAADYVWTGKISSTARSTGDSPQSACANMAAACYATMSSSFPNRTISTLPATKTTETSFTCHYSLTYIPTGQVTHPDITACNGSGATAQRSGDSCPANKIYNSASGTCSCGSGTIWDGSSCVADNPCAQKFGQDQSFKLTGNTNDPASPVKQPPRGGSVAMPDISVGGCAASARRTQCLFHGDGAYTCSGTARFTGEKGNTNPALDEPYVEKQPELTSDASQECSQWVEDAEGRRTRTCQTSSTSSQTGKNTCERGAYDQYCFQGDPSPTPESDTATRTDNIKETPNADGSKTTETTSTTTKTYCQAGACTTTNTTNKTTVVTGSDGKVQSETSECSGSDCDEPESPEEEKPKMPGPFKPGEKGDYLPEIGGGEESPTYAESLDDFTDRVSNAPIVSGLTSISVPSGGSCSMGSAQLFGGSVSFNDFCTMAPQVLAGLRYLFLAIWAWAAIRLFFTA